MRLRFAAKHLLSRRLCFNGSCTGQHQHPLLYICGPRKRTACELIVLHPWRLAVIHYHRRCPRDGHAASLSLYPHSVSSAGFYSQLPKSCSYYAHIFQPFIDFLLYKNGTEYAQADPAKIQQVHRRLFLCLSFPLTFLRDPQLHHLSFSLT